MDIRHYSRLMTFTMLPYFISGGALMAQEKPTGRQAFENEHMVMRVSTSKPENLEAFYTGRGFSKEAITEIKKTCYVTAFIKNKSQDILWLILNDWVFYTADGKPITRITRSDWKQTWERIGLKPAHQSTFGWTQLPESRDLHFDEHAAGNVTIPWQIQPFKLTAKLRTKPDQSGEPVSITFENLQCRSE